MRVCLRDMHALLLNQDIIEIFDVCRMYKLKGIKCVKGAIKMVYMRNLLCTIYSFLRTLQGVLPALVVDSVCTHSMCIKIIKILTWVNGN